MSVTQIEFPQGHACARKPGANRADRDTESEARVLVAQPRPRAEDEHVLLVARERREQLERLRDPALVRDPLDDLFARIRLGLRRRNARQGRAVAPPRTAAGP